MYPPAQSWEIEHIRSTRAVLFPMASRISVGFAIPGLLVVTERFVAPNLTSSPANAVQIPMAFRKQAKGKTAR